MDFPIFELKNLLFFPFYKTITTSKTILSLFQKSIIGIRNKLPQKCGQNFNQKLEVPNARKTEVTNSRSPLCYFCLVGGKLAGDS